MSESIKNYKAEYENSVKEIEELKAQLAKRDEAINKLLNALATNYIQNVSKELGLN